MGGRRDKGDGGPPAGGGCGPEGVRTVHIPEAKLLQNGGRGGRHGKGEGVHVGGLHHDDVDKNSLSSASPPAWLQFHLYGAFCIKTTPFCCPRPIL